jgi:predicted nucleic acid-binding protein
VSFLLDTNVLAEVRKPRPHAAVIAWFEGVTATQLFLSVLAVGEIQQGVERLRARDPRRAAAFEGWLRRLRTDFADRVLPVTEAIAVEWGRLNARATLPVIDGLMAATARVHGLTVVTRNAVDFRRSGVPVLDPFE